MGIGNEDETAIAFEGNWREFAPIALTNTALTFVTLGIYRFWATTRERQYLWGQTRFIDDNLEWSGRGIELFFGFIIALTLFGIPFLIFQFVVQGLLMQKHAGLAGLLIFAIYIFWFWLAGFAVFRGLRYRLSRTYWHGIHGGTDRNGIAYGWSFLWRNVVAYICAAVLFPWSMTQLWKERWEAMSFGPHTFVSHPEWSKLMPRYLIAYFTPFALIVVLLIIGAAAIGTSLATASDTGPSIAFGVILVLIFYAVMPLVALIYYSAYMREVVSTLEVSTIQFEFTAKTRDWIILMLGNIGIYVAAGAVAAIPIVSFGLISYFGDSFRTGASPFLSHPAAYIGLLVAFAIPFGVIAPFIRYRSWSFYVRHLEAGGEIDLAALTQSETRELRQGEGLLDAFDMGAM